MSSNETTVLRQQVSAGTMLAEPQPTFTMPTGCAFIGSVRRAQKTTLTIWPATRSPRFCQVAVLSEEKCTRAAFMSRRMTTERHFLTTQIGKVRNE
jgi:hypothetical protein